MYQVNVDRLEINGLVQNIDILSECGHYHHTKFPWHAKMVDLQCKKLETRICSLSVKENSYLIIGLARIPIDPVIRIINECLDKISIEQFCFQVFQLCLDEEYCTELAETGPYFLDDDDPSVDMILHYLHKSNIPITAENIKKEFENICRTVIARVATRVQLFLIIAVIFVIRLLRPMWQPWLQQNHHIMVWSLQQRKLDRQKLV